MKFKKVILKDMDMEFITLLVRAARSFDTASVRANITNSSSKASGFPANLVSHDNESVFRQTLIVFINLNKPLRAYGQMRLKL